MKNSLYLLISLLAILSSCGNGYSQLKKANLYNLDFETLENGKPLNWVTMGNKEYAYIVDSVNSKSGNYSLALEYNGNEPDYGAWEMIIPHSYEGTEITLSGYIKTENIEDGFAGLWMRIDPGIDFYNMNDRGVKGTNDWEKFEIKLNLSPKETEHIAVGGMLWGKGKMWIDNLNISIDGKDISLLEPIKRLRIEDTKAYKNTEFDNASSLTVETIEKLSTKELSNLGLIWGYLKYYHPAIQEGKYNWDAELFRLIPRLSNATTAKESDAMLAQWIDDLGDYEITEYNIDEANIKLQPDLGWITTSGFSKELTNALLNLRNAKREKKGYYINFAGSVGNPIFTNERPYESKYPDAGIRLLSLYRYWNIIQYFFPNRHLIGENWIDVMEESVPQFLNSSNEEEYVFTTVELITKINDTHADAYLNPKPLNQWNGTRWAIENISFVENKAIATGYYNDSLGVESPLKIGDEILSINDKSVKEIIKDKLDKTPASNYPTKLRDIASTLLRSNDEKINVQYIRDDKKKNAEIDTYSLRDSDSRKLFDFQQALDTCFRMVTNEIAYLYMGTLKSNDLSKLRDNIQESKGLIIDIRCYPADFRTIYTLSDIIIPKPGVFFTVSIGSGTQPGLFTYITGNSVGKETLNPYNGNVVILVNEDTQSMAEFAAMAFKMASNSIVMGSTTAGADGNISVINLPGGIKTTISGIGILWPDKSETQRIGIVPDVEVTPTIAGIKAGKDEVLEKAILYIESKNN